MALVDVLNQLVGSHSEWLTLSPVEPLPRQSRSLASRQGLLSYLHWTSHR